MLIFLNSFLPISIICVIIIACTPGPIFVGIEEVSEENLWGGYKKLGVYTLLEDVFIRNVDLPLPNIQVLVAPREKTKGIYTLHFSSPFSISEYENNKNRWPDIKGIIVAGTRFQVTRLIKYKPLGYSDSLYIYAKIINSSHSGKEVEISELSLLECKSGTVYLHKPNPKLIVENE